MPTVQDEIERYLTTGEHDQLLDAWPGRSLIERAQRGTSDLRAALLAEVRSRTAHATIPEAVAALDTETFARAKAPPMVHGLFPAHERTPVLDMLTRSAVFETGSILSSVCIECSALAPNRDQHRPAATRSPRNRALCCAAAKRRDGPTAE